MEKLTIAVPLNEKRLLSVEEFQLYSSLGRNSAFKMIKEVGCGIRFGRRLLVDRQKFDNWCSKQ
jgi:hypothetical protein